MARRGTGRTGYVAYYRGSAGEHGEMRLKLLNTRAKSLDLVRWVTRLKTALPVS